MENKLLPPGIVASGYSWNSQSVYARLKEGIREGKMASSISEHADQRFSIVIPKSQIQIRPRRVSIDSTAEQTARIKA